MSDEPIEPQEYLHGVTVVDIGDIRVARGMTRRLHSSCRHRALRYDQTERRVWCADCETDVDPFDAFAALIEQYDVAVKTLKKARETVEEAGRFQARSLAAKHIDAAWRKRDTVPACPHCRQGLFPEDFKNGVSMTLGRDYAEKLRERKRP